MAAPFIYHGNKDVDAKIYEELKLCKDFAAYKEVRDKYNKYFTASRPYRSTVTNRGQPRFPMEWNRTLKNLKEMYGFVAPSRTGEAFATLLRDNGR